METCFKLYFVELDKSYNEEQQQQQQQREGNTEKNSISNHNQASMHDAADSSTKQNQRECDSSNALKPKPNHQAHKHKEQNVYKKFNNSNNVSNKVQVRKGTQSQRLKNNYQQHLLDFRKNFRPNNLADQKLGDFWSTQPEIPNLNL